ncbi:hypothetical protein WN55_02883 [Dufourea novaeangliae]|uniref:Uncharacterized protein n=1 Tax=Dufourea novaeangliae TaxID=178035 RepID=A0A154PIB8_DUFNO|nr:hypothetical protein WN55_02883 [Dufourea novaeangliae]
MLPKCTAYLKELLTVKSMVNSYKYVCNYIITGHRLARLTLIMYNINNDYRIGKRGDEKFNAGACVVWSFVYDNVRHSIGV